MKIVFFAHPPFFDSRSMNIYIQMLEEGMRSRGHQVEKWTPKARLYNLPLPGSLKKWMGYIDQFIIFPQEVKSRLKKTGNAIFVFSDNALGPWVPLVKDKPHVIHCHDFMAQNAGKDQILANKVSWTGRQYQSFIRKGYAKGNGFISVSKKTQADLHEILNRVPKVSEVVYNGINRIFQPLDTTEARNVLSSKLGIAVSNGYLLHVGGNLWYKNRKGVIEMYNEWRRQGSGQLPLILVGEKPDKEITQMIEASLYKKDIF